MKAAFILQLKNRFQALADMSDNTQKGPDDANIKWEQIKNAYSNSSEVCLGIKQKKRKEWITADTCKVLADRRALKNKLMEARSERIKDKYKLQYRETDRTVKRMAREII